ncbi:MAG: tyrosine-type recombinase/integrase [Campylobacter sp.]|nr:tyrosine-type recombinase/integrase [Campylobacter sp.]
MSDFILRGRRYQKTWRNLKKSEAQVAEAKWRREILNDLEVIPTPREMRYATDRSLKGQLTRRAKVKPEYTMTLSEVTEWMFDRVWQFNQDSKTPPSRMNTIIRAMGNVNITDFDDDMLAEFRDRVLNKGIDGKRYSAKSYNHFISTLKVCMDTLEKHRRLRLPNKPTFAGTYIKVVAKRIVRFSDDELDRMRQYFQDLANKKLNIRHTEMLEYFIINSNLGLRPAEYYALEVGDIDFVNKSITISRAIKNHSHSMKIGSTKNGVSRTLPIDGLTLETFKGIVERIKILNQTDPADALRLYLETLEGNLKELYHAIALGNFKGYYGTPLERCPITTLHQKYCEELWNAMLIELGFDKKANSKHYTMYGLRHTVASRLAALKGYGTHKLMLFMGHLNALTSEKYVHLNVDDLRDGCNIGIS